MGVYDNVTEYLGSLTRQERPLAVYAATGAAVAAGLILVYRKATGKRYKMPPGPTPLPLLGNMIEIYRQEDSFEHFDDMRKRYGDLYTLYVGTLPVVMLSTAELVREAYIRKGDAISGRPRTHTFDIYSDNGKDILFGQPTEMWKTQRKIIHGALRKYATGDHLEKLVTASVDNISDILEERGSEPVNIEPLMSLLVYNIIAAMTFGKQYELDDEFFTGGMQKLDEFNDVAANGLVADYFPIFRFIPTKATREIRQFNAYFLGFFRDTLREHRETYSADSVTDVTYQLLKMEEELAVDDSSIVSQMTETHFLQLMSDLFLAGTDTTRLTLAWLVQYMAMYPDIQKKMQDQIHDIMGSRRHVTLADRERLPFVYAVIHEVLRLRPIAPLAVPHVATEDTSVAGYDIPKGSMVVANIMGIHRDPEDWPDPEAFKPERYLDSSGQFVTKPGWLPFSTGKRVCVGESLAKAELQMIVTLLFHQFSFRPAPGDTLTAAYKPTLLNLMPKPFQVVASRNSD